MFDSLQTWFGIPSQEQPANHYRLLGIELFESSVETIDAGFEQRMTYLHGCSTGEHAEQAEKLMNEVSAARLILLNPEKKASYDASLRRSLAAPVVAVAAAPVVPAAPAAPISPTARPAPPRQARPTLAPPVRPSAPQNPFGSLSPRSATDAKNFAIRTPESDSRDAETPKSNRSAQNWIIVGFSVLVSCLLLGLVALILALVNPYVPPSPGQSQPSAVRNSAP
ncbi:hypothetical protein [Rosistilla oblonga]|uniref:hypothetical protein n=1 Tax=Rosistilla oblonga TaxID=2527990 RepID=UPI003A985F2C